MEWCAASSAVDVGTGSVGASQHHAWVRYYSRVIGESAHASYDAGDTVRIGSHCGCHTHRSRVHHHRRRCRHAGRHERHRGWSGIGNEHGLRRCRARTCQLVHRRRIAPRLACQREVVDVDIQATDVAPSPTRVSSPDASPLQSSHKENYTLNLHVHTRRTASRLAY